MIINKQWNYLSNSTPKLPNEDTISYLLRLRGIKDQNRFLNPSIDDLIALDDMKNIDSAANVIINGINDHKRFLIHFDVDIDGISAGTIMYRYLEYFSADVSWCINKGKIHGLKNSNINTDIADILIIVDSLDQDYTIYDELKQKGVEIVILDHHEFEEYPESAILVSSAKNYKNPELSGSGVVWKFCAYLDQKLNTGIADDFIDLCACGIIGDVCDISEKSFENRYLCDQGLNNLKNIGLKSIVGTYEFNSQSIIWSIAPLINAANRMNENELAVELFLCDKPKQAKIILEQIKEVKLKQDELVKTTVKTLQPQINPENQVIYGFIEDKGIAGLVASKIADMYQKPTIIFHKPENNELKGSIRGYSVENFRVLINSTGLAISEGHDMAAGIRMQDGNLFPLIDQLNVILKDYKFDMVKNIDLKLDINNISFVLIDILNHINKINGKGFKPISIALEGIEMKSFGLLQNKHFKGEYNNIEFICWKNTELYDFLIKRETGYYKTLDVTGELNCNIFAGKKRKQFIINDYKGYEYPEFLRDN